MKSLDATLCPMVNPDAANREAIITRRSAFLCAPFFLILALSFSIWFCVDFLLPFPRICMNGKDGPGSRPCPSSSSLARKLLSEIEFVPIKISATSCGRICRDAAVLSGADCSRPEEDVDGAEPQRYSLLWRPWRLPACCCQICLLAFCLLAFFDW